jgi:cytochrome c-type biogenesis protein CcmF
LIFLMGVGPLIAWRRSSPANLAKTFTAPLVAAIVAGLAGAAAGLRQWYVLTAFSLVAFVLGTILAEFRRGVGARRRLVGEPPAKAFVNLVAKNNRRYGGYVIHLGVILAFVGIVASSFFRVEVKKSVKAGESIDVGPYELFYTGLKTDADAHVETERAEVEVLRDGKPLAAMEPAHVFYKRQGQPATIVALRSTPLSDLYVVLAGVDDATGQATFQIFLTPLVFWLWAGGVIMALGTVIVMWPNVRERAAIASAITATARAETASQAAAGGS